MSESFASSNPFRRRATGDVSSPPPGNIDNAPAPQRPEISTGQSTSKKVRVVSPPPSMFEPDSSIADRPPTPPTSKFISRNEHDARNPAQASQAAKSPIDPFLSGSEGNGDKGRDNERPQNIQSNPSASLAGVPLSNFGAPSNPFKPVQDSSAGPALPAPPPPREQDRPNVSKPTRQDSGLGTSGKASMDVDAFKRLIMTGKADQSSAPTGSAPQTTRGNPQSSLGADGGSSTDTSSLSRQSILEPSTESSMETPRTSHEISVSDEERLRLAGAEGSTSAGKKKPEPPRTRHGKLFKMPAEASGSSQGKAPEQTPGSTPLAADKDPSSNASRDLNKPLPTPPRTTAEPVREIEIAGSGRLSSKTAESSDETLPSMASAPRKTPPAPPVARRHSQRLPTETNRSRSNSARSLLSHEESSDDTRPSLPEEKSSEGRTPPPPPPARRPTFEQRHSMSTGSSLRRSHTASSPSRPELDDSSSTRHQPLHRTPSSSSSKRSSTIIPHIKADESSSSSNAVVPPPPPPPRRHHASSRASTEIAASQAPSTQSRRRSSDTERGSLDSTRRMSATFTEEALTEEPEEEKPKGPDVLADLSALQREVDELRGKFAQR